MYLHGFTCRPLHVRFDGAWGSFRKKRMATLRDEMGADGGRATPREVFRPIKANDVMSCIFMVSRVVSGTFGRRCLGEFFGRGHFLVFGGRIRSEEHTSELQSLR